MKMRLRPVLRYELRDMALGCLPFFGVMTLIVLIAAYVNSRYQANVSFTAYGFTFAICLFVYGIVSPRACLRLCAQLGVSRRTGFVCCLAAALCTALLLSLGGELLQAMGSALGGAQSVQLSDMYQMIYAQDGGAPALSLHGLSFVFNASLMLALFCGGMFFTFLFWRLSRFWTVVAALAIPVVINGAAFLAYRSAAVARAVSAVFAWGLSSVWNAVAAFLALAVVLAAIDWLLVRRANVRASGSR